MGQSGRATVTVHQKGDMTVWWCDWNKLQTVFSLKTKQWSWGLETLQLLLHLLERMNKSYQVFLTVCGIPHSSVIIVSLGSSQMLMNFIRVSSTAKLLPSDPQFLLPPEHTVKTHFSNVVLSVGLQLANDTADGLLYIFCIFKQLILCYTFKAEKVA